jgi:signal transduction histidine kinase
VERTILVAEDSPTQQEHLRLLLEGQDYRVEVVANGREGLERLESAPPDLIISDVVMPEVDGYAFCQAVKSAERTRRIPFVLLTERNTPADFVKGLQHGADNFITKPVEGDYLLERVRRIFENLELRRQGRLDVEITLTVNGQRMVINADRQQMIELLFATLEEVVRANGRLKEAQREVAEYAKDLEARNLHIQEASRFKSEFLANMSHELRTPLNGIIGFAELMHDGKTGPVAAEHKEYLGDILASSRHLLQLINDVLDLSKVESGTMEFRPEPVDLTRFVGEVCDVLRGVASRKRIRIDTVVDPEIGPVVLDPAKLKQILYNYLSNAVKFTPEEGRVIIRAAPEGAAAVRLEVEDAGPGIAPEDLGRLFVEFQQLDAGVAKRHKGTGLGLALTKRLVEAQGGWVGVRSTPGLGSVFFAVLPRATRPAVVQPVAPAMSARVARG